jgi:TRAP-type mannitol/chloroaromatic compound transport system permease small subunit
VPQLADLVYERNKDRKANTYINFKGFIVRIYPFDSLICFYCWFCLVRCYLKWDDNVLI